MSDQRKALSEESLRRLHAFLLEVRSNPSKYIEDQELLTALSTQGRLAGLERSEAAIKPMSLNTAKRAAEGALEGGYGEIDRLRLQCAEVLVDLRSRSQTKSPRETKKGLRERKDAVERQLLLLSEDLQLATSLIRECLRQARAYADRADAATQALCVKEQRDMLRMLSLLR